jgi:hypothetical protein
MPRGYNQPDNAERRDRVSRSMQLSRAYNILSHAKEIRYETGTRFVDYGSNEPFDELEKYNKNRDITHIYHRGEYLFKNSQKRIKTLINELFESYCNGCDMPTIEYQIIGNDILRVNNFVVIV